MGRWFFNLMPKLVALVLTISIFAVACGGGTETDPARLIPQGSNLIGQVNVAGILSSDAVTTVLASLPEDEGDPPSLDKLLEQAFNVPGIDFRRVSRLVFFGDISREDDFIGLIAKGTFDEAAIVEAVERAFGKSSGTSENKGRRVYNFGDTTDDPTLAFIEGNNLVLGTRGAVQAAIDVQDGERQRLSGPVRDAFDDLGQGLLSLAVEVPREELPDQLADLGDIPFLGDAGQGLSAILGPLQDLEILGLALAQNGQILILRANLDFGNEDSASSVGKLLEGIFTLAAGLSPDAEVRDLLENLEVSSDGSRLTMRLEVAASEIGSLVGALGEAQPQPPRVSVEAESLQTSILSLMVDKGLTSVSVPTTAANDFTSLDFDPGPGVAYLLDYLRQPTTNLYYCWDDLGRVFGGQDTPGPCPRRALAPVKAPQPIKLGKEIAIMLTKDHVPEGQTVAYSTVPPTSGDHWRTWADCGFYEGGLPDELITHNLEHGNIVVSYNLADQQDIDKLRAVLGGIDLVEKWGVTRYYDKIPQGSLMLAAWGRLDIMQNIDRERIATFFRAHSGLLGPEVIACSGAN